MLLGVQKFKKSLILSSELGTMYIPNLLYVTQKKPYFTANGRLERLCYYRG